MLTPSTEYQDKTAFGVNWPVYLIHFDGETTDYTTSDRIIAPDNTILPIVKSISGNSQSITPEEGRSSIGEMTISILDYFNGSDYVITKLLGDDTYNLHRKKTIIKGGYRDLTEAQMAILFTGWVTDVNMWNDGTGYDIIITDPQKWLQRKIFRGAETTPFSFGGNPITIMLRILLSTGNGTNGKYDVYDAENGLGIDASFINVSHIEKERERWFPSTRFSFDIQERLVAKDFLEKEIFQPCNIYPIIKGDGTFDIKVFRPPFPDDYGEVQSFDEDVIIGLPTWDENLNGVINEIEFHYDYNSANDEYDSENYFLNATSIDNRGCGKKSLKIESKGIKTTKNGVEFITKRSERIFTRYASPPPIITIKTFFSRHLSEVGDIVPVTHTKIPNLRTSSRGITNHYMEIIKRNIDWVKGICKFTLLYTSFTGKKYAILSPTGHITNATTNTLTLTAGEGESFRANWGIDIYRKNMVAVGSNYTIVSMSSDIVTLTTDLAIAPSAGYKVGFTDFDHCTTQQRVYGFLSDTSTQVGTTNASPYYIY